MASPEERLEAIEQAVRRIDRRLEHLEQWSRLRGAPPLAGEGKPSPPPVQVARPGEQAEAPPPSPVWRWERPQGMDLEELLGGRVLAWVGGSAVLLGVVFFLVMAVSRGWIDEPTRVVLAFFGSTLLVGAGLYLYERQGQTQAALASLGTGIAALYASLTAATALYDLVSPELGLAVAALIGAVATVIAVRWDSPQVAGLGIVGALLSPVLVEAGVGNEALAFMAFALLSAVGVLLWRRWDWLAAVSFLVSAPQLAAWATEGSRDLGLVLAILGAFWLLYMVAAVGYEVRVPTDALRNSSALLVLGNVALIAGLGWFELDDRGYENGGTVWILGLAAVHLALGIGVLDLVKSRDFGGLTLALAIGLSGLGFALALDGPALVTGWAAHAAALAWVAGHYKEARAALGSLVFLGLAAGHVLTIEAPPDSLRNGVPDLGDAVLGLAALAAAAFAYARLAPEEPVDRWMLDAVGAAAVVYLLSVTIVDQLGVAPDGSPEQDGQVILSAVWSLGGLGAIVYGLLNDDRRFRLGGLALLGLAVFKVFFYDLSELESIYRVLSFIALGLLLLVGAFAYQRIRLAEPGPRGRT
jgi:uncharacterized membrane protein